MQQRGRLKLPWLGSSRFGDAVMQPSLDGRRPLVSRCLSVIIPRRGSSTSSALSLPLAVGLNYADCIVSPAHLVTLAGAATPAASLVLILTNMAGLTLDCAQLNLAAIRDAWSLDPPSWAGAAGFSCDGQLRVALVSADVAAAQMVRVLYEGHAVGAGAVVAAYPGLRHRVWRRRGACGPSRHAIVGNSRNRARCGCFRWDWREIAAVVALATRARTVGEGEIATNTRPNTVSESGFSVPVRAPPALTRPCARTPLIRKGVRGNSKPGRWVWPPGGAVLPGGFFELL